MPHGTFAASESPSETWTKPVRVGRGSGLAYVNAYRAGYRDAQRSFGVTKVCPIKYADDPARQDAYLTGWSEARYGQGGA
jgi:hypothetical protein